MPAATRPTPRRRRRWARPPRENLALVYGGGNVRLMGIVADAVLEHGGEVVGVIPQQLVDWEVAHKGLTRLEVVDSMHARKARMFDLADGFVALPGGFGTLDEMFEMLTWIARPRRQALRLPRRKRVLAAVDGDALRWCASASCTPTSATTCGTATTSTRCWRGCAATCRRKRTSGWTASGGELR